MAREQQYQPQRETDDVDMSPGVGRSALQLRTSRNAAVQRQSHAILQRIGAGGGEQSVHAAAAEGVKGSGSALPHLAAIQRSFGRHDVSGVQAHVGGKAAGAASAIGAEAYATGNSVAFAQQPDLHTAAHEAAHIVQQRSGVKLDGGVGEVGDRYEQHANAVADAVAQGSSSEVLLDGVAPRERSLSPRQLAADSAVQRKPGKESASGESAPLNANSVYMIPSNAQVITVFPKIDAVVRSLNQLADTARKNDIDFGSKDVIDKMEARLRKNDVSSFSFSLVDGGACDVDFGGNVSFRVKDWRPIQEDIAGRITGTQESSYRKSNDNAESTSSRKNGKIGFDIGVGAKPKAKQYHGSGGIKMEGEIGRSQSRQNSNSTSSTLYSYEKQTVDAEQDYILYEATLVASIYLNSTEQHSIVNPACWFKENEKTTSGLVDAGTIRFRLPGPQLPSS